MGYKADKADGKTTVIKTRPGKASVPEVAAIPAVFEGEVEVTPEVPAVPAVPEQTAAYRIEVARTPTVHNITMAQALEDLDNAQAVVDDLIALNGG